MTTAPNIAPKNIAAIDAPLRANLGLLPFATEESAPMPVIVSVRTLSSGPGLRASEQQHSVCPSRAPSRDGVLPNPPNQKQTELMGTSLYRTRTLQPSVGLEDLDRALIVETLEQVGWIVGGPRGAAAQLDLKRTTLLAKMRRLGIFRPIRQEETGEHGIAPETIRREDA